MEKSKSKSYSHCPACRSRQYINGTCRICGFMSAEAVEKTKAVIKRKKRKKISKKSK